MISVAFASSLSPQLPPGRRGWHTGASARLSRYFSLVPRPFTPRGAWGRGLRGIYVWRMLLYRCMIGQTFTRDRNIKPSLTVTFTSSGGRTEIWLRGLAREAVKQSIIRTKRPRVKVKNWGQPSLAPSVPPPLFTSDRIVSFSGLCSSLHLLNTAIKLLNLPMQ